MRASVSEILDDRAMKQVYVLGEECNRKPSPTNLNSSPGKKRPKPYRDLKEKAHWNDEKTG
jgi:hypothetical protein